MSFIDKAKVIVLAGNGGDGKVSFRQEKFVDKGGPNGGDGGNGGSVLFEASRNQNTLASFRYQKELKADDGQMGGDSNKHGRNGADLTVQVPVGTVLHDEEGVMLADLAQDGQKVVVLQGGRGGFGNAHFVSSKRQAPKVAEKGERISPLNVQLELKMIADVGLVGLPNAGKSTLLSVTSNARPEIANYPFTTLKPNLGMVPVDKEISLLFADIPGLIEGAAEGKGLGDEFLRHVERTAVLVHLIDAYNDDVAGAYRTIIGELAAYKINLAEKPQIVVLNKIDGLDDEIIADKKAELGAVIPEGTTVYAISAQAKTGLKELLYAVSSLVSVERAKRAEIEQETAAQVPTLTIDIEPLSWRVTKQNDATFLITGRKIERFASRTDFENEFGIQRLVDIMKKMGIMHELRRQGLDEGAKIKIADKGEFTY